MKRVILTYFVNSFLFLSVCLFTSCLTSGLDDMPAFEEAEITDVKFDFRYKDPNDLWIDGEPIVKVTNLIVENKSINSNEASVTCTLRVPETNASFTEAIRNQVSLSSIVGKFNISIGANIAPIDGAPVLGMPGDFSSQLKYKVTAADKTTKVWTVHITGLSK